MIICVDLMIQRIPGKHNFRIQDSNTFLSASLSLSFGVMVSTGKHCLPLQVFHYTEMTQLFSSLFSMLPSARDYLNEGGLAPDAAQYTNIGCFLGGVIGIQSLSRIMHHYIPSHVVDCDHTHDEDGDDDASRHDHHHDGSHTHGHNGHASEGTPLLSRDDFDLKPGLEGRSRVRTAETTQRLDVPQLGPPLRRPTLQTRLTARVSTFVSGAKSSCDEGGPCYGYSEPCGQECLKVASRSPTRPPTRVPTRAFGRFSVSSPLQPPGLVRTTTTPQSRAKTGHPNGYDEEVARPPTRPTMSQGPMGRKSAQAVFRGREGRVPTHLNSGTITDEDEIEDEDEGYEDAHHRRVSVASATETTNDPSHHHHVPSNAFLAIGLQTSIAIALHKLPEGFITYATNHANPKLGFTVFMALFIHNITEGFAMALPLYLAINNRWKAMFWSSLFGGVSQPLGAGVAALWFKVAGRGNAAPGDIVYGCMFAITAGIMASVALHLFSESLSLTHNRNLCTAFAFLGMGILGISFALTSG